MDEPIARLIDAHVHCFPPEIVAARGVPGEPYHALLYEDPRRKLWDAPALIDSMDEAGVTAAAVVNWGWQQIETCRHTNDYLLDAAARYPGRLFPFVMAPPSSGNAGLREIERCVAGGARGIGECMPAGQADDDEWSGFTRLAQTASEHNLVMLIHASEPVGHSYPGKGQSTADRLVALAASAPDTRFMIAHAGGGLPFFHLMPEVAATLANVWYDSAATPFLYDPAIYRQLVDLVGVERALFASDAPLLSYRRALAHLSAGGLTGDERDSICWRNAASLFGISEGV